MKLAIFSDLHAHNHQQFATVNKDGRNSRLMDCVNIIYQVADAVRDYECDGVVFVGDLFHSRTKIDVDVLDETCCAFEHLVGTTKKPVFMLRGNHDTLDESATADSLSVFDGWPDITVVRNPMIQEMMGVHLWMVPWMSDPRPYFQQIENEHRQRFRGYSEPAVLFLHQAVSEGAVSGERRVAAKLSINDIPCHLFGDVIAGDYHKFQLIPPNFMYCGSPLQLTAGEAGDAKYIHILDTDSGDITHIETGAPKFHLFENPKLLHTAINNGLSVDLKRDFVRCLFNSDTEEQAKSVAEQCSNIQLQYVPQEVLEISEYSEEAVSDDEELLDQYIYRMKPNLEHHSLLQYGKQLLGVIA